MQKVIGKSAGFGKVTGRISADHKVLWRLDYDPEKGSHINVEDYRNGKGDKAKKFIFLLRVMKKHTKPF